VLKDKEEELEQLEEILIERDHVIEELERQIGDRADVQSIHSSVKSKRPQKRPEWYRSIKGDLVDEIIAKYFNALRYPLPVKRLGDGFYIFGTKKIFVKLLQGRLVVRVGGGYMSIEEFLEQYADMEQQKVQQLIENGTFNFEDYVTADAYLEVSPKSKSEFINHLDGRKSVSKSPPRSRSPLVNNA